MLKKFWNYGTYKPIQRIGLIIILIGFLISLSYSIKMNHWFLDGVKYYFYSLSNYPPEYKYDGFYAFYPYVILLGLLLTWFYPPTSKLLHHIKNWICKNK